MSRLTGRGRLTIRGRLTASYAGLVIGGGAILIAVVYLYMRYVPSYALPGGDPTDTGSSAAAGESPEPASVSTVSDLLRNLVIASSIALVVLAIVAGIVGWLVAARIIKPLKTINAAANRAATGALDHRIALVGPDDEVHRLADTFDRMLESLERSFEAQRRFAANASHELRTPLATTKTMIDVTLADPDADAPALRALAVRVADVNQDNIEIVEALLALATAEATTVPHSPVDLVEIVTQLGQARDDEARRSGIVISTDASPALTHGDATLVRQAVDNLLRNSLQHNLPGDGRVDIRTWADTTHAHISVTNTGPPVDHGLADSLREPFVRAAGRTAGRRAGHGLGLAIVDAIATAHHGSLRIVPRHDGGLAVTLTLPIAH